MQSMMMRAQCAPCVSRAQPAPRAFSVAVEATASTRKARTQKRHSRLRHKLSGTTDRPRLSVYRSNEHIYAQVIDDTTGSTLAAASTLSKDLRDVLKESASTCTAAEAVGKKIAELCTAKNITKVAFDRGGNVYTGRVKAVAEGARAAGLDF